MTKLHFRFGDGCLGSEFGAGGDSGSDFLRPRSPRNHLDAFPIVVSVNGGGGGGGGEVTVVSTGEYFQRGRKCELVICDERKLNMEILHILPGFRNLVIYGSTQQKDLLSP